MLVAMFWRNVDIGARKLLTAGSKVTEYASVQLSSDYADIVALSETWLTNEDTISVSEFCRDNFTSPAAWRHSTW